MDLENIHKIIKKFSDERDWQQFHSSKNLSMALSVEVSELVEIFQWLKEDESDNLGTKQKDALKDEVADVAIYLFRICMNQGIDLEKEIIRKMKKNEEKYPVEKCKGSSKKYNDL